MISEKERWFDILSLVNEEYIYESNPLNLQEQPLKKITESKSEKRFIFKSSKKVKKFVAIAASCCLTLFLLVLCIIVPNINNVAGTELEYGFYYSNNAPLPSDFCAYKSDTNEFEMDNVSLTFFYGGLFASDINQELENVRNIPEFDVYFGDADNEPVYTIAHSNENYVSEKYRCDIITDESQLVKIGFTHSEVITIPKSLFSEEQGVIRFCIRGVNVNEIAPELRLISCIYINYDVTKDEKVILSPWDGYRN